MPPKHPLAGFCAILVFACLSLSRSEAADLFVSPSGKDSGSGRVDSPVATLGRAKTIARRFAGKESVTVHVADGIYSLQETLVFEPEDSGSAEHPIVYVADNEGKAILSGGRKLDLSWTPFRDGIFVAKTPDDLLVDQLFVDGKNQRMARYPNYDASQTTQAYQGFAADAFSKQRAQRWANPVGGYIHAMHRARWGGYHYRITGKDANGDVTYEGGWQNNRQMGMHAEYRMVENIFEELDAPGEWFHDASERLLYYLPSPGIDLPNADVRVVRLRHLVEFQGSETSPVKFITLDGFVVRHAARTFMETKEPMLRSDWTIYRGGAIRLTGTEDVRIANTEFDQVGGNAVFASNYNRRLHVQGCHIHDSGASGVCLVGDPGAVRDPLFEYRQKNDLSKIDRTPGPRTDLYPADCVVEDCLIHGIGRVERQPAGVQIEMSHRITVRDCSIYDCARAGINVGDGAWGGHLIEGCDVFDTVQETHDHGSFNSWGRDRYWRSDHRVSQEAVDEDATLPFLDAMSTTVIRHSRWRCDHGWGIDLDDGSSNYDIHHNLVLGGGIKLREGFRRRVWNNVTINNGLHPHVWFADSGDEVFANIFMRAHMCARMPGPKVKGKRVDANLFYTSDEAMRDRYSHVGWDAQSLVADPRFIDPKAGDFRVGEGSPAFQVGFENFAMDSFGVKKPGLRQIARTPEIPDLEVLKKVGKPRGDSILAPKTPVTDWLGARVRDMKGQEFSAFGVSKQDSGVVVESIGPASDAAKLGLIENDVIQFIDQIKIKRVADLLSATQSAADAPVSLVASWKIVIVRNQETVTLSSSKTP